MRCCRCRLWFGSVLLLKDDRIGDLRALVSMDATELSSRLRAQQLRDFPPSAHKTMRRFTPPEAARFIGITEGYLRQIMAEGRGPQPLATAGGHTRLTTSRLSAAISTGAEKERAPTGLTANATITCRSSLS